MRPEPERGVRRLAAVLIAAAVLGGCGQPEVARPAATTTPTRAGAASGPAAPDGGPPVTASGGKPCATTRPGAGPTGEARHGLFGWENSYGNGSLWVGGLWPDGVIAGAQFVEADGSVGIKFGWWRAVDGELKINGRRLDAPAPPLRADIPSGYGLRGFQSSGVHFPTEGCWEVTGAVGTTMLTFVTFVTK
jgi:hypothetical protein